MIGHRNRFIQDVDLNESTSLTHLLNRHTREDDEDVETQMIKHSPFYGQKQFADLINNNTGLSIIDLNTQNIFAKFDELVCFIETFNVDHTVSAICLNECWLSDEHNLSVLHLEVYNMYFQRGNRVGHGHCGLIVYVHKSFLSKEIVIENANTSWDYLCVQLSHNSPNSRKYILCNVYRLPCYLAADIDLFNAEFCSLLRTVTEYFDNVISSGFFPKITLPTRIQENSNTLINQIWSNNLEESKKSKSGILINDISDHKMIFTFIENIEFIEKFDKLIKIKQ